MPKRLDIRDIRQFDEAGIAEKRERNYLLKEGIIRWGAEPESFYVERAQRLYRYEAVDRIILLSRATEKIYLEKLAGDIIKRSNIWRRAPDDRLIREREYKFTDKVEIIDSERKGEQKKVEIFQINLVSDLYFVADYYISEINRDPEELPKKLVRVLAGLPPKELKESLFKDIPHYDPKDVLDILIQMTADMALIEYFEFFRSFFVKKHWETEEIFEKLKSLLKLKTPTGIHAGLFDLHQILDIIHKALSTETLYDVAQLNNELQNYFQTVPNPEKYTDMLFRRCLDLFAFLQKYEESEDFQDKLYFLEESRKKIRESENLVEANFVQPFKKLYLDILKKWMDITFREGEKLLNRASLKLKVQTKRATWKKEIIISVSVKNIGMGSAEDIQVVICESPQYEIMGEKCQTIKVLNRNETEDIDYLITPLREDSIDLAFYISHGDRKPSKTVDTLVFVQVEEVRDINNPYYFTKPAGESMFFGRENLLTWLENNIKGRDLYQNILIEGQRRAGKTSFLRKLEKRLSSECCCVYIDVQLDLDPETRDIDFLRKICERLKKKFPNVPSPSEAVFAVKSYGAFSEYVDSLSREIEDNEGSGGIILIFDEFDKLEPKMKSGEFKVQFLRYLRGFFQRHKRVSGIISGNLDKLDSSEWKEFFAIFDPKRIGALEKETAEDLVKKPVKDILQYDQYAVKKILDFSGRNPYYIQIICNKLVDYIKEKKKSNFIDAEDVDTVVLNEARETARHTLELAWDELEIMEKNTLYALSQERQLEGHSIKLNDLYESLSENVKIRERWKMRKILDSLMEKDIVTKSGDYPNLYYDFSAILFRDWVTENGKFVGEQDEE